MTSDSRKPIPNTLSSLRKIGKSFNCIAKTGSPRCGKGGIIPISRMDIDKSDELAEKTVESDDYDCGFMIAPLNCHSMLEGGDNDGERYWSDAKPKLIEMLSARLGLRYGIDFVILRRGVFSLLAPLTKDEDGEWKIPEGLASMMMPLSPEVFLREVEWTYRNTDRMYFPINAIMAVDRNASDGDFSIEDWKNVSVGTVQVDISFLRSESFHEYDSDDGREHTTMHLYAMGLMYAMALEHRILSFDEETVDDAIGRVADGIKGKI